MNTLKTDKKAAEFSQLRDILSTQLANMPELVAAYLFGSAAQQKAHRT